MKYLSFVALFATASAIKMGDAPYGLVPDCEYHKSEDLSECIKIIANCNPTTAMPVLAKCPVRLGPSERTDVAPKNPEMQSSVPPTMAPADK